MNIKEIKISDKFKYGILYIAILATNLLGNLYRSQNNTNDKGIVVLMVGVMLSSLITALTLSSYIVLMKKPIKAVLIIICAQIVTASYDIAMGATIGDTVFDLGAMLVISIVAFILHNIILNKKLGKRNTALTTLKRNINYEREPLKVSIMTRIIVYSLSISLIMTLANRESSVIEIMHSSYIMRVYAAITLVMPLLTMLGILSTSMIAYDMYIIQIIMEIGTIKLLYKLGTLHYSSILSICIELIVAYIVILNPIIKTLRAKVKNSVGHKVDNHVQKI